MINLSAREIADIVGGKLIPQNGIENDNITQVVTDSRSIFNPKGSVFFALVGPRNNGHKYIPLLIEKGIRLFVVSEIEEDSEKKASLIKVKNTTAALQKIAAFNRKMHNYPVIGITGSNGKTIVKEWLHEILHVKFKIIRSPKSYNSQIGVPLSVLLMNNSYNLGIFEAGISQPGEMANLSEIISPDIGIFTTIGDAHQENFISLQQKIREKLLLFKNSKSLIYRKSKSELSKEIENFCDLHKIKKVSWTLDSSEAFIQFSAKQHEKFTQISATLTSGNFIFNIPFTDNSAIENACHCFAASVESGIHPAEIISGFGNLETVAMRLEIKQGINNCLLINDFYNSDLNSLSIALSVLHQQAASKHLHKLVILSDIQQTGLPQKELYLKVNQLLKEAKIDELVGIGPSISKNVSVFSLPGRFFQTVPEFQQNFKRENLKSSVILIKGARQFRFEKISEQIQQKAHQTLLEINLNSLVHNLNTYKSMLKQSTKIMVMVKAFSYGSGDVEIAKLLEYNNVDYLAVAVADEGVQLREAGIQSRIIVMNPDQQSFQHILDYNLEPNIYSKKLFHSFIKVLSGNALYHYPIHIKIDTGMNRLGFKSEDELIQICNDLGNSNLARVHSVFTHLAATDAPDLDEFTFYQIKNFEKKFDIISSTLGYKINRHVLNSAGIERFSAYQFEMVRLGIGLYGISNTGLPLQNIGTLKSTISQVKEVSAEETVGYNRMGKINKKGRIAVVPVGYADGLDRKLGNGNGFAFVNGKRAPILGNICMDMLMLDVSDINVNEGDSVELFGPNISITELAHKAQTIPYEILTGISQRVKRVYIYD